MMRVSNFAGNITEGHQEDQKRSPVTVTVREFDPKRDCRGALAVESSCNIAPAGKMSLFTHHLGDPISRIRQSPSFLMLVAEVGDEIVGLVRGTIKVVTCGCKNKQQLSSKYDDIHGAACSNIIVYTKLAYVLGLRVSPSYRRMGIGLKLVQSLETWFRENDAEYAYMATDKDNDASLRLFIVRLGYTKFRNPSILGQPVYAHKAPISPSTAVHRLSPTDAETIYRHRFSATEFFPKDIDAVLRNELTLASFLAVPAGTHFDGAVRFLENPPESWGIASVWDCSGVYLLEVRGASRATRALAGATRYLDRALPWLRLPSVPDVFRPFGFLVLYGMGGEGAEKVRMVRAVCGSAHNLARERGCRVLAAEVAAEEPLRAAVPHWRRMSWAEDVWCMKRLAGDDNADGWEGDWSKTLPGPSIFVDPREF